jgi:long-subunit acyl-CoA synthetase (AMP-forming)
MNMQTKQIDVQEETLLHRFQHWARQQPNRRYMTQPMPDGSLLTITWGEAWRQACCFAAWLQTLDLPPGSSIGLLGRNSAHWILADAGIWLAGHVTVPLYPTLNAETANHVITHGDVRLLVLGKLDGISDTWNEICGHLPEDLPLVGLPLSPRQDILQWKTIIRTQAPLANPELPCRSRLATIVYTSGSTGRPKGVMHSFGGMMAVCESLGQLYSINNTDRMLSYLPLAHVAERAAVEAVSLYFGCEVFFAQGLETFQADLKRAKPTLFLSVPRLWTKFYQAIQAKLPPRLQKLLLATPVLSGLVKRRILKELGLDAVRAAVTGSAPLPENIIRWYRKLGLELLDCYGMSENFGTSHASRPGEVRIGYVGSPVPGVACTLSEEGEVLVRSPGQMMGYYKDPEKTAQDMTEQGYFRTGDRGEVDSKGRLRITGRVKDLFKTSKGKYVAPVPIEQLLGDYPQIESACVTGPEQPQPFALIVLSESIRQELRQGVLTRELVIEALAEVRVSVNQQLEKHERLQYLVIVNEVWTTGNGFLTPTLKVRRPAVEDHFLPQSGNWRKQGKEVIWL